MICQRRPDTIIKEKLNGHGEHALPVRAMDSSCTGLLLHHLLPPLNTQTPPGMLVSSLLPLWIPHEGFALEECDSIQHCNLKGEALNEAAETL